MTFEQFKVHMDNYIGTTFCQLIQKSVAEEQAIVSKHLKPQTEEEYDLSINKEIKLKITGIPKFSRRNVLLLCILSWYLPPITSFELQESLRSRLWSQQYFDFYSYIETKDLCLYKLYREDDFRLNDIFGNVLQRKRTVGIQTSNGRLKKTYSLPLDIFLRYRERPRPKPKVFKRGYNDHGSLPDVSEVARRKAVYYSYTDELRREQEKLANQLRIKNGILSDRVRLLSRGGIE